MDLEMLPFWNERADDIPLPYYCELLQLKSYLDPITLGLIYSLKILFYPGFRLSAKWHLFSLTLTFILW